MHALTDVTGFGLLGHLLEMCRGSRVGARIRYDRVPLLIEATKLAEEKLVTGASARNWASYGSEVKLGPAIGDVERALLTDPQTSGGLLVACAAEAADAVLATFRNEGFGSAAIIGETVAGPARVEVVGGVLT